jgi:hypothetical protein
LAPDVPVYARLLSHNKAVKREKERAMEQLLERLDAGHADSLEIVEAVMRMENFPDDGPDDAEPGALVCAPRTPVPHGGSGAITLPEPEKAGDNDGV